MGLVSDMPGILQFYGIMTAVFAVLYALMYWGARRNVRELQAMGRDEVRYYDQFIGVVEGARPVVLPVAAVAFVGGVVLPVLLDDAVAGVIGLIGFGGYMVLLVIGLGWIARKGVEAGEQLGHEDVDPFTGPFGLPKWVVAIGVHYVIFGVVFGFFWHAGMLTEWAFAPILWFIAVMAVFLNPVIIYRRYRSLEGKARTDGS